MATALLMAACGPARDQPPAVVPAVAESAPVGEGNPSACVDAYDPSVDYFPDKVKPRYARQFQVAYHGHTKLVTVAEPWQGAEHALRYLLVQCGTPRPEGFEDATTIEIPARPVITTSTTELPHIVRLGLVDRLVGHDEFDYVSSPEVRRRIESGAMVEIGQAPAINVELVLEAAPDLLLADSFGDPDVDLLGKLRDLGVPVALVPSFLETSALGRAEWIAYTALFFNRERRALETFGEVETRYLEIAGIVRERAGDDRPTVFTGAPIGEVWHVPGGASYFALLLRDAGARYLWADDDSTGSLPLDLETVYERALTADVWLHPGIMASLDELRAFDERFAQVAAFRQAQVYGNDARLGPHGGNDYWETGTARPDLVLADLVEIFHPGLLDHELVYHRRLE
jgi:cobalamin transport system substrate-binding protein